jgi:hypothetical protein
MASEGDPRIRRNGAVLKAAQWLVPSRCGEADYEASRPIALDVREALVGEPFDRGVQRIHGYSTRATEGRHRTML